MNHPLIYCYNFKLQEIRNEPSARPNLGQKSALENENEKRRNMTATNQTVELQNFCLTHILEVINHNKQMSGVQFCIILL